MGRHLEQTEQIALMRWAAFVTVGEWKLADILWHYPAGGYRTRVEAAIFRAMGTQDGVPDLMLAIPMGGYAGGWWELKVGRNKPTEIQMQKHALLRSMGHYVQTYWHWAEAAKDILRYLERGPLNVVVRARL